MNTISIAGAIASKTGITLYLENGAEMNLPSDSWRTKAIMDQVTAPLARGKIVSVNLDEFSIEKIMEDKTAGVIRFIRKTMTQLQEMLDDLEQDQTDVKTVETTVPIVPNQELVAIVKSKDGSETMIPGVEKLEKQMEHAVFTGNTKGLERFMQRIAAVIKDRGHTVQELLNFMERGDLPIADDGSIVAYKVLKSSVAKDDTFYDCHTGKVAQRLGSVVYMDPKLVDPSRRTECSTGLHIARRGYLRGFGGDIITLVKVAPEDVIAVPQGEPDKMRAASYHIVGVLPSETHSDLRANRPMTANSIAAKMLADVIAGNHVKVLEKVRIGEAMGEKVKVRELKAKEKPAPKPFQNGEAKALDDAKQGLSPKEIRETARKAAAESTTPTETKAERDARKKREKRAAEKAAKLAAHHEQALGTDQAYPVKAKTLPQARIAREPTNDKVVGKKADIIVTDEVTDIRRVIPGESKSERDARIKREKRAAAKAAKDQA